LNLFIYIIVLPFILLILKTSNQPSGAAHECIFDYQVRDVHLSQVQDLSDI